MGTIWTWHVDILIFLHLKILSIYVMYRGCLRILMVGFAIYIYISFYTAYSKMQSFCEKYRSLSRTSFKYASLSHVWKIGLKYVTYSIKKRVFPTCDWCVRDSIQVLKLLLGTYICKKPLGTPICIESKCTERYNINSRQLLHGPDFSRDTLTS